MINGLTDVGKLREINEDNYFFFEDGDRFVIVVSDGMGGHNAGEVASEAVVEAIKKFAKEIDMFSEPEKKIRLSVLRANDEVFKRSLEDKERIGMGATVVMAVGNGKEVYIGNVGDSRGYLVTKDKIHMITEDHSYVNELLKTGVITKEEARVHPRKNEILKAVGVVGDIFPDIFKVEISEGDMLLLCTDGLTNMVEDSKIFEILNDENIKDKVKKLIDTANENGGSDNITAVLKK